MAEVAMSYSPPRGVVVAPDAAVRFTLWTDGWASTDYADGRTEWTSPDRYEEDDDDD